MLPGILRGRSADRLKHGNTRRINIATSCNTHTALNHCTKVSDDVAKHIIGHDHIEPFGIFYKPHSRRVYVSVICLNTRVLFFHFIKCALPKIPSIGQHICFSAQRYFLFLAVALLAVFKRIANTTFHTLARVV